MPMIGWWGLKKYDFGAGFGREKEKPLGHRPGSNSRFLRLQFPIIKKIA